MKKSRHLSLTLAGTLLTSLCWTSCLLAAEIKGRVTDLVGRALPGAQVEVSVEHASMRKHALTDEFGNYQVKGLPPGVVLVTVNFQGFEREQRQAYLRNSQPSVSDFGLVVGKLADYAPANIGGIVRASNNVPLFDATVTVVSAFNERVLERSTTDAMGRYQITLYNGGQFLVYASKPGFKVSAAVVVVTTLVGQRFTVDLVLDPLLSNCSPAGQ